MAYHQYLKSLKKTELMELCKKYIIQTKITTSNKRKEHLIEALLLHTELDKNGHIKTKKYSIMSIQKPQSKTTAKTTAKTTPKGKVIYQDPVYKTDKKGFTTENAPDYDLEKYE